MNIDLKSHVPIFQQIVNLIRAQIATGVYRTGEGLPSIRALAVELRVNHNTVQRAYGVLEREGLIRQRRGIGMFVTNSARSTAREEASTRAEDRLRTSVAGCTEAGMTPHTIRRVVEEELEAVDPRPERSASLGAETAE